MTDLGPGQARIIDRGYRHYTGRRGGVREAVGSLVIHSIQRALGMRRSIWAKVLPVAGVAIAYVPAIVFVGAVALLPARDITSDFLPSYGDYYGYVIAAIMVFVSLVAPEVLCTDRRSGMLGVYLSSPLDRDTYLLGKAAAVGSVVSLVCLGPPLLMLVANVLQSQGPEGAGDIALTLLRVLAAGLVLTVLYAGTTLGLASMTDRKSVASAGVILLFLMSSMVAGILQSTGASDDVWAIAPTTLSLELASRIHGEGRGSMPGASSVTVWVAWLAWSAAGFALARFNLQRLPVTR